jgi:succinate-semialdehyde dehydrogenase / glutarate-semialdehyde dehydrogenase
MRVLANVCQQLDESTGVLVGGRWQEGEHGTFTVDDPASGAVLGTVADAGIGQAVLAVDAAEAAAATWETTSPRHRSELLHRVFGAMRDDIDGLARLISAENGKSLDDARAEVAYAAEYFRWYAEEAVRPGGDYGPAPAGGVRTVVTHRPVGIAALVTPWNFPAAMATRKLAPALAAGCTTVLKPAAETPLTALAIARLLSSAGVPDGVVNVLPTTRPGEVVGAWLQDSRVRKLSFTGSTAVGRLLLKQAADRVMNTSMELGGNAPFIVTEDTDLDDAVAGAMVAKFRGGGQACTAANRFYVHDSVHDQFVDRFAERVRRLVVGRGTDPSTEVGPLISRRAVAGTEALVEDALARGARIAARADTAGAPDGHFFAPTLLVDVPDDATCVQQEIFAPLAPVVPWSSDDDLLRMVNGTDMGLAAYIYCRDLKRALQLAERVEAGMVALNRGLLSDPAAPFGGVKQSGLGREGAREGLLDYQETQYFSIDWS